jgi:hypothetical protein
MCHCTATRVDWRAMALSAMNPAAQQDSQSIKQEQVHGDHAGASASQSIKQEHVHDYYAGASEAQGIKQEHVHDHEHAGVAASQA